MSDEMNERSAEWYRERGKLLFFGYGDDAERRSEGLSCLIRAYLMSDPEASYHVAVLMLDGVLKPSVGNAEEEALRILRRYADSGYLPSRELLNRICLSRYERAFGGETSEREPGPLTDFDGEPIRIDRKGLLTPIDAELEYSGGKNVLRLSADIRFIYAEDLPDVGLFERAVLDGMRKWQGEYTVFGGQKLSVEVRLTVGQNRFDHVIVVPLTSNVAAMTGKLMNAVGTEGKKEEIDDLMRNKRSFAISGPAWSVRSRKIIYIQSEDGRFLDAAEISDVAKHEFGHALGLGDLYENPGDGLAGVGKGSYRELDSFLVSDKLYRLVMCDHHGPISNNDVEMILLAFRDNEMQLYQARKGKGKVSSALGKGN